MEKERKLKIIQLYSLVNVENFSTPTNSIFHMENILKFVGVDNWKLEKPHSYSFRTLIFFIIFLISFRSEANSVIQCCVTINQIGAASGH